jgi:Tfp pilus assembly protein PilW
MNAVFQKRQRPQRKQTRRRRGLSMIDAMVSLTITSTLLVAAGAAFTASASLVDNNFKFYQAEQAARISVSQMVTEIRRAQQVLCASSSATYFDVYRTAANLTANEQYRRFAYNSTTSQLTLTIYYSNGTNSGAYVLANNVTAATFGPPVSGTNSQSTTAVQRLPVSITVSVSGNTVTLAGSAATRCELAS